MKRSIYPLIILLVLIAAGSMAVRPVINTVVQKQLRQVFVDGEVSVGGSQWAPLNRISLLNIAIKREGIYDFKVAEIRINYSLVSILQKKILKVMVKEADIKVNLPRKNILDFNQYLKFGPPGAFSARELALSDCHLDIHSKDINVDAWISMELGLEYITVHSIALAVVSLEGRNVLLQEGVLKANQSSGPNEFHFKNIQYDKVKIGDLNGAVRLEDGIFFLDTFVAQTFNGLVEGYVTLETGPDPEYLADLKFVDLNLEGMINAFELDEKFQMSGLIGGQLIINGKGADIEILEGNFSTERSGGMLVITDPRILENIAGRSGQSLDILVESFKNYHYNNGTIALTLEKEDLLVDMALDGEKGKRDLNVVVHDFQLKKDRR